MKGKNQMSVKSTEVESKVSPSGVVIGIIAAILVSLLMIVGNVQFLMWGAISVYWEWYTAIAVLNGVVMTTVMFIVFLLAALVKRSTGRAPGRADLLFIMSSVTLATCITSGMILLRQYYYMVAALGINPDLYEYMPEYFAPRDLTNFIQGGAMPWGDWAPTIAIYLAQTLAWGFMGIFMISIWRYIYVDMQRVPFPARIPYIEQISLLETSPEEEQSLLSFKGRAAFLWAGFIIGALIALPDLIGIVVPGLPSILYNPMFAMKEYTGVVGSIIYGANLGFSASPFVVAVAMLVPLDSAFTLWVTSLVSSLVIGPILAGLGITDYNSAWGAHGVWSTTLMPLQCVSNGMLVGMLIVPLLLNRRFFIGTLKAAFGTKPKDIDETKEPLSYRAMYIGFIISVIAFIALCMIFTSNIASILLITFLCLAFVVAVIYTTGETNTGFPLMSEFHMSGPWVGDVLIATGASRRDAFYPAVASIHWAGYESTYVNPGLFTAFMYKMADETKVHPKVVFRAGVIAMLIGAFLGWPLTIYFIHAFGGASRIGTAWIYGAWGGRGAAFISAAVVGNPPPGIRTITGVTTEALYGGLVVGIILVAIINFMRMRYAWFPLTPGAMAMGTSSFGRVASVGFLVGWIIKLLVVRFGGARIHDEKFIPLVAGFIIGVTVFEFLPHVFYFVRAFAA